MLQKQRNELTVRILGKLKSRVPAPKGAIEPFSPIGESESLPQDEGIEEVPEGDVQNDQSKLLQVMYPSKSRRKKPVEGGPVY